jgi:hypothetical protein
MQPLFIMSFLAAILVSRAQSDMGSNLTCQSPNSEYQVLIHADETGGRVLRNHEATRFGTLICSQIERPGSEKEKLMCRSTNVADAGFNVIYHLGDESHPSFVKLYEIWIGGARPLATLPCAVDPTPEEITLSCRPENYGPDSIGYEVRRQGANHTLIQTRGDEIVSSYRLPRGGYSTHIDGYGGTRLFLTNIGRSGYLLIYSHTRRAANGVSKNTSLIDINLFPPSVRNMNTPGPRTDLICTP